MNYEGTTPYLDWLQNCLSPFLNMKQSMCNMFRDSVIVLASDGTGTEVLIWFRLAGFYPVVGFEFCKRYVIGMDVVFDVWNLRCRI
jgi:hypothetical protein